MVFNDQPTYKDRHARNSSWPGELISITGRIHLRRLGSSPLSFSLQSCGRPYILGTNPGHTPRSPFLDTFRLVATQESSSRISNLNLWRATVTQRCVL